MKSLGVFAVLFVVLIAYGSPSALEAETVEHSTNGDELQTRASRTIDVQQKDVPQRPKVSKVGNAPTISTVSLPPDLQASVERPDVDLRNSAMRGLAAAERSALNRVIRALRTGDEVSAQREWGSMISRANVRSVGAPLDINALVQHVLRESYIETNKDLKFYADKVRYYNDLKKEIRNSLSDAREAYSSFMNQRQGAAQRMRPQTVSELVIPASAKPPYNPRYRERQLRSQVEWDEYINGLEQQQQTVGDDAELANIDLRNALQKQQQTLQTMSNVSKMLHDTAMAIVRKIG